MDGMGGKGEELFRQIRLEPESSYAHICSTSKNMYLFPTPVGTPRIILLVHAVR